MAEEMEEGLEEARRALHDLRGLLNHPGWDRLGEILEAQAFNRTQQVIKVPLETMDGTLEQEFMKGEISGLELFRLLPSTVIEQLELTVKEKDDGTD